MSYSIPTSRSLLPTLTFVTGNDQKLAELIAILGDNFTRNVVARKIDLPELQGEIDDIAKMKCLEAARQIGGAVLVEDTSLCFTALGNLPGPYIKWFLEKLGPEKLEKLLTAFDDKRAKAVCTIAYCAGPTTEPIIFSGVVRGTIVPPRGSEGFGWDPIFQPENYTKTLGELTKEEKNQISHRYRAIGCMRSYFRAMDPRILAARDVDEPLNKVRKME